MGKPEKRTAESVVGIALIQGRLESADGSRSSEKAVRKKAHPIHVSIKLESNTGRICPREYIV